MKIKNVKTVGELETIDFIKSLQKNRDRILVDVSQPPLRINEIQSPQL